MTRRAHALACLLLVTSSCVLRQDWSALSNRAAAMTDARDAGADGDDATATDGAPATDAAVCGPLSRPCDAVRVAARGARFDLGIKDSAPRIAVGLSRDFYMDSTEVTVARFEAFVRARGGTTLDADLDVTYPSGVVRILAPTALVPQTGPGCNFATSGREQHPVNCVSWPAAMVFCAFVGGRLPTEAEYAYVARYSAGASSMIQDYPWGTTQPSAFAGDGGVACDLAHRSSADEPSSPCDFAQTRALARNGAMTAPVRSFAPAPLALYDLIGNVAEWSADRYVDLTTATRDCFLGVGEEIDPLCRTNNSAVDEHAFFGGDYRANNPFALFSYKRSRRYGGDPPLPPWVGFRCVYPAP